jgi:trigger factor
MKIVRNDIDTLNASLSITIERADYEPKFKEELNNYKSKTHLRGFRKGKTPASTIKRMYGKSILAETINNLLQSSLTDYLKSEELEYLGQPLPSEDQKEVDFNLSDLSDYEFLFDLGLAPEFEVVGASSEDVIEKYKVDIPDDVVMEELDIARKRAGEETNPEDSIEAEDILTIHANELENGAKKEGGWQTSFTVLVNQLADEKLQKKILKMKQGDSFDFNIFKLEKNQEEKYVRKYLLNMEEGDETAVGEDFQGTINKISRIAPAEMNQDFFDKNFGEGVVSSEEEAKEKVRERIAEYYQKQARSFMFRDIMDSLLDKNQFDLPDIFLKKWLKANNEEASDEIIEKEYDAFAKNLKWNLIRSKLEKRFTVEVQPDDIKEAFKNQIRSYFGGNAMDIDLDAMAERMMKNNEQFSKVYEEVMAEKLFEAIENEMKIEEKPILLDEFTDLVKKLNESLQQA